MPTIYSSGSSPLFLMVLLQSIFPIVAVLSCCFAQTVDAFVQQSKAGTDAFIRRPKSTASFAIRLNQYKYQEDATFCNYFAFGSNMLPDTMESLRNIREYASATPAILFNYRLVFHGAAAVEPSPGSEVHGVLYQLSPKDFDIVSRSEGVPFAYQWETCQVSLYPIITNITTSNTTTHYTEESPREVTAKTLVANKIFGIIPPSYSPPSRSYLRILQDGARYWNIESAYQNRLRSLESSTPSEGFEGLLLTTARLANPPLERGRVNSSD